MLAKLHDGQRRGAAPNMAGRRRGTGRPSDAFSFAIHDSLRDVKRGMQQDEELFAFLDDVYTSSPPGRTRTIYDALAEVLPQKAGIQLHTGKTRVWNAAGVQEFIQEVCEERLQGERKLWEAILWSVTCRCYCSVQVLACSEHWHKKVLRIMPSGTMTGAAGRTGDRQALSRTVVRELSEVDPGCLGVLVNVSDVLDRSGFVARPTWEELRTNARKTSSSS